jgi:hypothetical protein
MSAVIARGLGDTVFAERVLLALPDIPVQPGSRAMAQEQHMFLDYFAILLTLYVEHASGERSSVGEDELAEVAATIDVSRIDQSTAKSFALWQRLDDPMKRPSR